MKTLHKEIEGLDVTVPSRPEVQNCGSKPLLRQMKLRDGTTLSTLGDGFSFVLGLGRDQQQRLSFQEATQLMLEASGTGDVAAATDQLESALFLNCYLEFGG